MEKALLKVTRFNNSDVIATSGLVPTPTPVPTSTPTPTPSICTKQCDHVRIGGFGSGWKVYPCTYDAGSNSLTEHSGTLYANTSLLQNAYPYAVHDGVVTIGMYSTDGTYCGDLNHNVNYD